MIALYVALGGALGSLARYGLSTWVQGRVTSAFPWGTFAVNGLGSLLIGLVLGHLVAIEAGPGPRAFLVIGLLGGFTTFSAFSYETVSLLHAGAWGKAGLYAAGSVLVGVCGVLVGLQAAEALLRSSAN